MQQHPTYSGSVPVSVALALLASLRDLDTPADPDELAESDLPLNLRRRLGLSSVVGDQIKRYEKRKGDVSATEVASLFELVSRRPDATTVFVEAGQRIARHSLDERRFGLALGLSVLPQALRRRKAWGRVQRIAQQLSPGAVVRIDRKSDALIVRRGLPATAAEGGVGCAVLEGAIRLVFSDYRAGEGKVIHSCCEAQAGEHCAWELDAGDDADPAEPSSDPTKTSSDPAETSSAANGEQPADSENTHPETLASG